MKTRADKIQKNKNRSGANAVSQKHDGESAFQFCDNGPQATAQKKLKEIADNSSQVERLGNFQQMADNFSAQQLPIQKKENKTGLPNHLKSGIETLSGYSMEDVKVHYNSDKPAHLQAHAYTQGTDIHLASGQEKHLPHEAWHVVQQKQGRVNPTMQMKGVEINDEGGLEREADAMGAKALRATRSNAINLTPLQRKKSSASPFPAARIFDPLAYNDRSTILQAKGVIQRSVATKDGKTIYLQGKGNKELYSIDDKDGVFFKLNMKNGRNTVYKKVVSTGQKNQDMDIYKLADPEVTVEIDETTLKSRLQEIGTLGQNFLMIPDHRYPHLSIAYTEEDGVLTLGTAHYSRSHDDSRRLEYRRSDGGWTYHADVQGVGHAQAKAAADEAIGKATAAL